MKEAKVVDKQAEEAAKKFKRLCDLGHIVFNTVSGKEFIFGLEEMYLKSPVSPAGATERYACVREGQNEMVRLLVNMFNLKMGEDNE